MPRVRNREYQTRIVCGCGRVASLSGNHEHATDLISGRPVTATFRWHSRRERFLHQCRTCERTRRGLTAERRRARGRTAVPAMTARTLGSGRRFGVELELMVPAGVGQSGVARALTAAGITVRGIGTRVTAGWRVKGDMSIRAAAGYAGVEVVSPPLSGEQGEQQVRLVCQTLRGLGAKVNRTCGTHVHHDVNDLTVEEIKRVARSWASSQPLIDGLVSPSRRGGNGYCRHLSVEDLGRIAQCTTLEQIKRISYRGGYGDRYRSLNLQSYGKYGTVEVRQHHGTLNAAKIIAWIQLGRAIIDTAKVEEQPVQALPTLRELWTALGDRLDETARTFLTGRAVEYGAVAV